MRPSLVPGRWIGVLLLLSVLPACRSAIVLRQPVTLTGNLVVLPVRVNGGEPLPFLLDTGAGATVLDEGRAASLGLTASGGTDVSTGGGELEARTIERVHLRIGDLELPEQSVLTLDLRGLAAGLGRPIAGILGYEAFAGHVVTIDYAAGLVTFQLPAARIPGGRGEVLPIELEDRIPFVHVPLLVAAGSSNEPLAKLELDTGKSGGLTLLRVYADAHSLVAPGQKEVAITAGAILPGRVPASATRLPGLRLGSTVVRDVVTMLVPDRDAAGIEGTTVGILGAEVLKRFKVTVDYPRKRVTLEPSPSALERMEFDMSGLSLIGRGDDHREFVVRSVLSGSPAMEAGILSGDRLITIDGKPARERTLDEIRRLLRQDGKMYVLELKRGEELVRVDLVTLRLL